LAAVPGTARLTALTLPAAQSREASTPPVAPLGRLTEADLLVVAPGSIPAKTLTAIGHLSGVVATQSVEAGVLTVKNTSVVVLGVNPSTFRGYTPQATAASNQLWQSVANGAIVVSSTLGKQDGLSIGGAVSVAGAKRQSLQVGGIGTVGIAGVDAVVSNTVAHTLGLPASNAVVISAPKANLASLIMRVKAIAPANTRLEPLVSQTAGNVVSPAKITTMMKAAQSRVGMPYVYGAAGPKSFDCSGLVQWSFAQAGVKMPRVAADQAMTGPAVSITQLQPGDLLFYHTDPTDPAYISHVAIYIGNGKMVEAPRTGENVHVVAANTSVDFAGAVSVDPAIAAGLAG
jgi:cell wall-associated NlpC family hydrolase